MSKMGDWEEANTAGYYCLHDVLPKLGLIAVRDHKTVITDVMRARAFVFGVRQRLMLIDQMCMDQEFDEDAT
jgi:hypothetical protein